MSKVEAVGTKLNQKFVGRCGVKAGLKSVQERRECLLGRTRIDNPSGYFAIKRNRGVI